VTVKRALVLGVGLLLVGVPSAGASSRTVVHADGGVGPFWIGRTTEAQLRAKLGPPAKLERPSAGSLLGRLLSYPCGKGCWTRYGISDATSRLSDFTTGSASYVTEHGSYVGMSSAAAARHEGKRLVPGCGDGLYLHIRWDAQHAYVLTAWHGKIDTLVYLGPHSVYYDGLC
jgi:hypothetical protein